MSVAAEHWRLLDPPGAAVIRLARPRRARQAARRDVRAVRPGSPVVLECTGWGARWHCTHFARREGLDIGRSYVVLPTLRRASFRVEDAPAARTWFADHLLTTPPGAGRLTPVVDLAVQLLRVAARSALLGALAPGRVVVTTRAPGRGRP